MLYDSENSFRNVLHNNIQIYFIFLMIQKEVRHKSYSYLISLRKERVSKSDDIRMLELSHDL